jgi:hypothetical protein
MSGKAAGRCEVFVKAVFAMAAVCAGLATAMAADGIQPGLWKITTAVLNNGMQMPPQTNARCLTAEQAGDLADTFSPRFGGMNTTCQRTQYEKSEQKLMWRLECRGQLNMDSAAEFIFFSPLRYTAVISTTGWMSACHCSTSRCITPRLYGGSYVLPELGLQWRVASSRLSGFRFCGKSASRCCWTIGAFGAAFGTDSPFPTIAYLVRFNCS